MLPVIPVTIRRHADQKGVRPVCFHMSDDLEAVDRTHVDVCDHHIKGFFQKELEGPFGVGQPLAGVASLGIVADEAIDDKLVIIDYEEFFQGLPLSARCASVQHTTRSIDA